MLFLLRGEHEEVRMGPPAEAEKHSRTFLHSVNSSDFCLPGPNPCNITGLA